MNKFIVTTILIMIFGIIAAEDYIDLNFFVEPRYEYENKNMINFLIKNIQADSIRQVNVFGGRILEDAASDSMIVDFLNTVEPDLVSPTDYLFSNQIIDFNLLASNIKSDSIPTIENQIFFSDSIKVGLFALYTPDFTVKNDLPEHVHFDFEIPEVIESQIKRLAKHTDVIVMFSNLSKFIDADLMKKYEIDAIVSFDYQKKRNELLANHKTMRYSVLTNQGKYGKLRIKYSNGEFSTSWQEIEFGVK
ncbi:MAG: hypothetical protein DRI23_10120 [Candidatus Cloacimonadota bacterium]|nr:MAG: hypothetical protein DRI23_10120 [Candidatus Cloacimonadota bacterium]RLC49952.1 MAG: hypothetical protein DRH79_08320 [Candidatus Cloacimonadota bacterium]